MIYFYFDHGGTETTMIIKKTKQYDIQHEQHYNSISYNNNKVILLRDSGKF